MENINKEIENRFSKLSKEYSSELESIISLSNQLFPNDIKMTNKELDNYRALCSHSQNSFKNLDSITSHRKIIGPIIVFFKKMLWNILKHLLGDTIKSINLALSLSIINQAKLDVEIKRLKNNS